MGRLSIIFDRSLGREAANSLVEEIKSGTQSINLVAIVRDVMAKKRRHALCIGKKALEKENGILNRLPGSDMSGKTESDLDGDSNFVKLVKNIKIAAKRGKTHIKNIFKKKDEKEEIHDYYEELTSPDNFEMRLYDYFNTCQNSVISLGAGGIRGIIDPSKFACYRVVYPTINLTNNTKEGKIELLKALANCPLVPNSMFCFAGSKKIYQNAIKELERKN